MFGREHHGTRKFVSYICNNLKLIITQEWLKAQPTTTIRTPTVSIIKLPNTEVTTTTRRGNLGFGLRQAQNCGEVKLVNVMSPSPSPGQSEINESFKKDPEYVTLKSKDNALLHQ